MTAQLTVEALLERGVRRLNETAAAAPRPQLEAELLLAHAMGASRTHVTTHLEQAADPGQARRYHELIERRAAGEPLAYIVGRKEFWSLPLKVGPAVLVPRPETELLVERALALRQEPAGRVADLGTGSGAIALALASERPHWAVAATDISAAALDVARANAAALGLPQVEFLLGNWFEPLGERTFDLVVSNPPYVAADDPAMQDAALKHEPRVALTPGVDPLACLREIVRSAPDRLERNGWLLLEHGADQAAAVALELVARGFSHVRSHRDLAGHERTTEAQWTQGLFRIDPAPRTPMATVRFETTHGPFTIELFPKEAPVSVENFLRYVDEGFFDGTLFHRIVPGFVIQGGGLTADFSNKKTHAPIANEAKNGLKNGRGWLSMARTSDINSATSQFFVNLKDNEFLDHGPRDFGYAVFGRVTEGMETVDKIAKVGTGRRKGHQDAPLEDVLIVSARRADAS